MFSLQTIINLDTYITLWLNSFHTDYLDNFMEFCTGRFVWIPFYLSLAYITYRKYAWKECLLIIFLAIILLIINDQISSSLIRSYVARMRPANPNNPISSMVLIVDGYRGGRYGFPSAHAANCWGLMSFISLIFYKNKAIKILMIVWALLLCYTRIYLGVHYVGDILAGMLMGFINSILIYLIIKYLNYSHKIIININNNSYKKIVKLPLITFSLTIIIMLILSAFFDPHINL